LSHETDDVVVEVGVDKIGPWMRRVIACLSAIHRDRFLIRTVDFQPVKWPTVPGAVRFLHPPILKSKYIYFSDVDIVFLRGQITKVHLDHMQEKGIACSNMVRPISKNIGGRRRLTGLHFTPYSNFFPLELRQDEEPSIFLQDEVLLYELVSRKRIFLPEDKNFRPTHGIHLSPSRDPYSTPGWKIPLWVKEWCAYRSSRNFHTIRPLLWGWAKKSIPIVDRIVNYRA
jgi:hypothetical protein